jgi:hypothetical protein
MNTNYLRLNIRKEVILLKNSNTDYTLIYDKYYKNFASRIKYNPAQSTKIKAIDKVFWNLSWNDQNIIRACTKYHDNTSVISKIMEIPKKKIGKMIVSAEKHIYSPINIAIAVPRYYKLRKKQIPIKESDFDNKYLYNRLIASGLDTREKILRHIEDGYYLLWTIPGCGDESKIKLLTVIDKWKEGK